MPLIVDAFILAEKIGDIDLPTDVAAQVSLNCHAAGVGTLEEFSQTSMATKVTTAHGKLSAIAFDASRETLGEVARCAAKFGDSPTSRVCGHIQIESIDSQMFPAFLSGTAIDGLGSLLAPRARHGWIVFQNDLVRELGALRRCPDPIWDFCIRAVRAGLPVDYSWKTRPSPNAKSRLPLLCPPRPPAKSHWLVDIIRTSTSEQSGAAHRSRVDQIATRAGILQWYDFLDESHQLSQSVEGEGDDLRGDYWHAIMHRREPDYANAKYWFRRLGNQATYEKLPSFADEVLAACPSPHAGDWRGRLLSSGKWNPLAFVDLCEACSADENSEMALAARRIQFAEMCLLIRRD
jgi:hypothetical protein